MEENLKILEGLLLEKRLETHFKGLNRTITITLEDLCQLLLEYSKLLKLEVE